MVCNTSCVLCKSLDKFFVVLCDVCSHHDSWHHGKLLISCITIILMFFLCNGVASAYSLEPIHPVLFMSAFVPDCNGHIAQPSNCIQFHMVLIYCEGQIGVEGTKFNISAKLLTWCAGGVSRLGSGLFLLCASYHPSWLHTQLECYMGCKRWTISVCPGHFTYQPCFRVRLKLCPVIVELEVHTIILNVSAEYSMNLMWVHNALVFPWRV